jgi:ppGpp synthetase/RelA/SpoT-type nucleotidyltranferase
VASPLSKSQVERLGKRLVASGEPADADLQLLHELLLSRSSALEVAIACVRDHLQLAPTSRIKNTGTILEKLRRNSGSGLKSMQDLAGMRIVGTFDRRGQDEVVQSVCGLFAGEARAPKVIDRRVAPMHSYAAVHVVVFPDDAPIEIQIRTAWQHEWAELFEKLADLVGRGIRYGEPPRKGWPLAAVRQATVDQAMVIATMIAAFEETELVAPDAAELEGLRGAVEDSLAFFRGWVEELQ